jgi:hypothetical protein
MEKILSVVKTIQAKLDTLTPEKRKALDKDMDLSFMEHYAFQNKKSAVFASGKLSLDVAQWLYIKLGEVGAESNGGWPVGVTLAEKIVVTKAMGELYGIA